ncbi:exopolyphosphatase [Flavobacterium agricola]|uniref:Exopolyphosphatase n=1 Tax=Flavobacterium agricola TaxID=2870839 RepID=A0ABY6M1B4_9FLAO|nr:exopolyphosphatase [Flavobacterium agricola]UYW02221.1 exopolyphosphatase [Flavobacterium agricola]
MITIKKYAAIDIGSNAMRLLIANIVEEKDKEPQFNKSSLIRVPIRLGQDVFTNGKISDLNKERMIDAMNGFKLLMKVYGVEKYKACATSAMREANNGPEVLQAIQEKAAIAIEVIDGKKEAQIIATTDLKKFIANDKSYLYIDVGGGSTEFSFFTAGKISESKSFKIGTVRLLNDMVTQEVWDEIEQWIKITTKKIGAEITLIGSGGNINKIFKLSGKAQNKPLSFTYLSKEYHKLNSLSYEERIYELGLNTDRADVIIHALKIYKNAMKWSGAKYIYVPKIGLSDGIVKALYYNKIK